MKKYFKRITTGLVLSIGAVAVFTACVSNDEYVYTLPSSATIRSFNLEANNKVLPNLDSVFFSIDLYTFEIFNADSLPFGTKVSALTPVISTESASAVEITYKTAAGNDTIVNYLENTTDTIDFRHPVRVRVVSYDGANECKYTVKVNVHQAPVDSMVWKRVDSGRLPSLFGVINSQHTAMSPDGTFYCLTEYQNDYSIARTDNPSAQWNIARANVDFVADINSLTATVDALYMIDTDGVMHMSTDGGVNWSSTGRSAMGLIGAYGHTVLGTNRKGTDWQIFEYPGEKAYNAPDAFPVLNASNAVAIKFEMAVSEQLLIAGGKKADGSLTADTWAYDGNSWVKISRRNMSQKLENMALVPYFNIEPDTISWRVSTPTTVLLAMHGNSANGVPNDTVYVSKDFGMNWYVAGKSLQIPQSVMPSRTLAQAYPFTVTYRESSPNNKKARSASAESFLMEWKEVYTYYATKSRATTPVTEWDIPYIYTFGGVGTDGQTYNTVYRGVITALTQKPIQ